MKTYREFITEIDLMRQMRAVSYGVRKPIQFVQTHPATSAQYSRALAPRPTTPTSAAAMIGIGAGRALYDYGLKPLGQLRRQQVQQRKTSMVAPQKGESGYYGTGRVAKITQR